MGVDKQEVGFESRLQHVKRGERRVAEMECHVQCLRDKLARLEKMLPRDEGEGSPTRKCPDKTTGRTETQSPVCPVDALAHKETFLRKQIFDMECTEKKYLSRLADLGKQPPVGSCETVAECGPCRGDNEHEAKVQERLSRLENYSQKLNSNLQSLEMHHEGLARQAENLSQVLDRSCKPCSEGAKGKGPKAGNCSCKTVPKCNSCIICNCNDWERDLENNGDDSDICVPNRRTPKKKTCVCYGSSSSSDSDELYYQIHRVPANDCKQCTCKDSDGESVTSDCSSDGKTVHSGKSTCTCYCSKGQSHEELSLPEVNCLQQNRKVGRLRGGVDIVNTKTTVVSIQEKSKSLKCVTSLQDVVTDRVKLLKVEELREGLERLKIRNRNLKDFLQSLEHPLALVNKPSESTTVCTEVSSCYTIDLAKQTRSGLLTVVKILESKCRNKDAIIVALADELKTSSHKKLRVNAKELENEKSKLLNTLMDKNHTGRRFTKKDSAIGFLILLLILISHVKRSEMVSYFVAAKKVLTGSPFNLIQYFNEMNNFSLDTVFTHFTKISTSTNLYISFIFDRSLELISTFGESLDRTLMQAQCLSNTVTSFLSENQLYVFCAIIVFLTIALVVNYRQKIARNLKLPDSEVRARYLRSTKSILCMLGAFLMLAFDKVLSSRSFWLLLGFCIRTLWDTVEHDVTRLLTTTSTNYFIQSDNEVQENIQTIAVVEEPIVDWYNHYWYNLNQWIAALLGDKLQSLLRFTHNMLENVY